jgi:hypothetical protein
MVAPVNPISADIPKSAGLLTAPEQYDFELIIANARTSGWIASGQSLTAERSESAIVVRSRLEEIEHERCYSDDPRWIYELLHDLAQGIWRQRASERSAAGTLTLP